MNTLIANQYGRVQGEAGGCALTLSVTAQTPRRESVQLQTSIDSVEQQLHLLAILRAVERRIEQFQLHDAKISQTGEQESPFDETVCCEQIGLLLRDELSVSVALNVSSHGLRFDVQTPLWRSEFVISKANDLATLAVFTRRAINQEKTIPIRFGSEEHWLGLRRRNDGQVLAEFEHDGAMERIALSTLQLYELEILTQYALHRAFEPPSFAAGNPLPPETATAA